MQPARESELPRSLGLVDSVAIVAGTMIGSGIFLVPNLVARNLTSAAAILAVWVFTGILSFFGALAYAELGTMIPATGGEYVYLRECYPPLWAFLCGWTLFFTTLTASVAWLAINFATYLGYFIPLTPLLRTIVALTLIAGITGVNYRGASVGADVQKIFTFLKLLGLAILIGGAFWNPGHPAQSVAPAPFSFSGFGVAMISGVLAYDGWVALSFVAGEVRHPKRTLPLALALGIAVVMSVYVLANVAYLQVLTIPEIAASERVGAQAAERALGPIGASLVTITVLLSIVGSANGWTMTSPRMYFAQSRDGLFPRVFGKIHPRYQTPHFSIVLFGAWSALLVLTGTYETLASFAMFAAWVFYGLTAAGVLVLRRRYPDRPRPYKMWGYPITLLLFLAVAVGFVGNTFRATPGPALAATLIMAAGIPVYFVWKRK
ncbi:MAG TPA: amino acid permease [Bryobacteraceae bacterium]|nr:amino acid permease [Bryobacteraceae bacterium]